MSTSHTVLIRSLKPDGKWVDNKHMKSWGNVLKTVVVKTSSSEICKVLCMVSCAAKKYVEFYFVIQISALV